ncbi:hypothetical protein CTheo_3155 [Ceratobasidium theobromae]|uniref:Uncharacterized protein n=1 Tax=Ceratobasidium theobromae TaxID=1582974 RepID=A0A5N5QQC0_9AGAM|nr:hypothetical protein CTheo_3155 [Ceratobasidium theobromae]
MPVATPDRVLAQASGANPPGARPLAASKPSPVAKSSPLSKPATVSKASQPQKVTSPKGSPSKSSAIPPSPSSPMEATKKVRRKGSKPIINWFQRKLAGRKPHPIHPPAPGFERGRDPSPRYHRPISQSRSVGPSSRRRRSGAAAGDADAEFEVSIRDGTSIRSRSLSPSLGPESMWSPSMQLEADDDASIRPLPPTSPPSPSPSTTTHLTQTTHSGYVSDLRTVASHTASTKPTTLLSVDIGLGGQLAHIAQAHNPIPTVVAPSPTSAQFGRFPSTRSANHQPTSSTASVTFSNVPPYPSSPLSTAPYFLHEDDALDDYGTTQVPTHSLPHPRNNPRPSSPPLDNASTLTLASSTFNLPRPDADAISASVRAIRRRGSWESGESRWSAVVGLRRPGSSRTGGSWRTGGSIVGGGITPDPDHIECSDSGSDSESEDRLTTGPDSKPEEVPLPGSPVKNQTSLATPLSILTDLPVTAEKDGRRTSDDGPSTAVPGRTSLDIGDETEKESSDGHGQGDGGNGKVNGKKKVDVVSTALDSLPE